MDFNWPRKTPFKRLLYLRCSGWMCVCGALCVCVPYPTEGSLCCLLQSLAFFLSLPFSPTAVTTADLDGKLLHPTSNSTMCASLYPCSPAPGICSIQIYSQMSLHIPLPMAPHRWSFILWWRTGLCLVIRGDGIWEQEPSLQVYP